MLDHQEDFQQGEGTSGRAPKSELEPVPLLEAAAAVTVSVEILKEAHDEILTIARVLGCDDSEAVRTVLLSGLGYESGRLQLLALDSAAKLGTEFSATRVDSLVNDLAAYHSMYSVLKYKAFKLYKQNQRLEFNNAGLRAQEQMWQEWSDRMRRERAALSAEVPRLRSLLSEFRLDWESSGGPALPQAILDAAQLPEDARRGDVTLTQADEPEADYVDPRIEAEPRGFLARLLRFLRSR